jgi:subtilisin family serine protease
MDRAKHLREQVESVLDADESPEQEVIVRMASPPAVDPLILSAIMDGVHRRAVSTNPRDMLPAPANKLPSAEMRPTPSQRTALNRAENSLSAVIAGQVIHFATIAAMRSLGLDALQPLLDNDFVKRAIVEAAKGVAKKTKQAQPVEASTVPIWASYSAVLTLPRERIRSLPEEVPSIQDIYPNRRLYVPPIVALQELPTAVKDNETCAWGLVTTGALAAWGAYGARGKDVLVGLLDTGVDPAHPDLAGKVSHWAEFDGGGQEVGSKPYDSDEHGTHCAGTICGANASGRYIGMAPEAKLAVALVMNGRHGTDAQILAGMQWAIERDVDVISMSLGGLTLGPEVPNTYELMIYTALRAGIPVVTAIGNSGSQTSGAPGNDFLALSVGATDHRDRAAGFSGGRTHVIRKSKVLRADMLPLAYSKPELSAPGVAIYSSVPVKVGKPQWKAANGTSMATPHVAGAVAQLLSGTALRKHVTRSILRAQLIQDLLVGSVEELGEVGQDHRFGFGRLDVLRALGAAHAKGYGQPPPE